MIPLFLRRAENWGDEAQGRVLIYVESFKSMGCYVATPAWQPLLSWMMYMTAPNPRMSRMLRRLSSSWSSHSPPWFQGQCRLPLKGRGGKVTLWRSRKSGRFCCNHLWKNVICQGYCPEILSPAFSEPPPKNDPAGRGVLRCWRLAETKKFCKAIFFN